MHYSEEAVSRSVSFLMVALLPLIKHSHKQQFQFSNTELGHFVGPVDFSTRSQTCTINMKQHLCARTVTSR